MCGIVGIAGNINTLQENAFTDLLFMDALRGFDSVGVANVTANASVPSVYKKAVDVSTFIDTKKFNDMKKGFNRLFIGHNRAATKGVVNDLNAHPFAHGDITGVHNGTIRGTYLLKDYRSFDVDSDNVFYHIDQEGVADLWSNLNGAAALVWWNSADETLNFLRNAERPLHYMISEDTKTMYWASEPLMLVAALSRNRIALKEVKPFEVNKHYSIHIPKRAGNVSCDFTAMEETTLVPFVAPKPPTTTTNRGGKGTGTTTNNGGFNNNNFRYKKGDEIVFTADKKVFGKYSTYLKGFTADGEEVRVDFKDSASLANFEIEDVEYIGEVSTFMYIDYIKDGRTHVYGVGEDDLFVVDYEEDEIVRDHTGEVISQEEFEKRYFVCSGCGNDLEFTDNNEYLTEFQAFCPNCADNPELENIKGYIKD